MKTVRFGIIGTNTITDKVLFGAMQDNRFELAAVCSRTEERAREFAGKYNVGNIFTSPEEMAKSDLIDAVYIATPNFLHASQAIMFMENGKHVLCEKPLASNLKEVRAMVDAAKKNGVVLMEAMKPTLTPNFGNLIENMPKVGKLRRFFSSFCRYSSRYDDLKNGILPNAFNLECSNGSLGDIGVYTIYPMVVLFGRPKAIKAHGIKLNSGADGQGVAIFDYGDMDAVVIYSKIADSQLPTEIQGEDGIISLDRVSWIRNVSFKKRGEEWEDITVPTPNDEYFYEVKEFIDIVLSGTSKESLVNSHENSIITMEIMDEIRRQIGIVYPAD